VLTQSISADRWTLVWTRDGGPGPMILDCFHAHPVDVTYSQAADKALACEMTVSFDALPYARSDDPEILSFNSPSVGWVAPPSSIIIDSFATSTNMFTGDTLTFEGSAGFWSPRAACTSAISTAQAHSGTHSLAVTSNSTSTMSVSSAGTVNATQATYCDPGETVSGFAWVRSAATVRAVQVGIEFYDPSGLTQLGVTFGTGVNDSTSAWTQIFSGPIVVPAGAYLMRLVVQIPSTVASEVHYVDDPDIERNAANWLLGPTGPPVDDANFETSIGTWVSAANATPTRTTAQFHGGAAAMQLASVAAGAMSAQHTSVATVLTNGMPCYTGDVVAVGGWVRTASLARSVQFGVAFYDATGTVVGSTLFGATVVESSSAWTWVSSGDQVVPINAAFAVAVYQVLATAAANEIHYVDDVSIDRGPTFSYNDTGLWFQSTVGAYGRLSAHWVRTTHDYALYDHYLADTVDLTGLRKLSVWVGLGTNKYSQWHTGRCTARIVLYDANMNSITATVTFTGVASALTTAPRWQKISGTIPFSGTFDYTSVSRYTVGIWNKVESIPQAGMPLGQQVLQAECYLDTLRADGPTTGNPFARGAIYSIPGVVGTAPAALSLQLQPGPASPPITAQFQSTSGTQNWTAPAGVTLVQVAEVWAAGGGGGYGISAANGGGGGGAGEYACEYNIPVTPSTVYHPFNGAPGAGGNSSSHPGGNGQASYFTGDGGKQVYAHGGQGGGQKISTNPGIGGHGSTNSKHFDGGDGANPSTYNNPLPGGGGGSSGGTSQDGADGGIYGAAHVPGAARVGGGPGGDGGHQIVQDGPINGSVPPIGPGGGGGGGATRSDGTAGNGAAGFRGMTHLTFSAGAGALMKTAIIHLPSRDVPSSYAPYIVTGNGTDTPNGSTVYTAPVTGTLQARYKGTYQVVLTNFSWSTPTVSRTITVTVQQHKADGTTVTFPLARTIANVSTDPDHVNLANGIVLMGTVTLPLTDISPGNNTDLIQILVNDTNTSDRFYDTLLLDTAGQTVIYSASGSGVANLWVTEPDIGIDFGLVYGSGADWDQAVAVMSDVPVASGGPLAVLPGENPLLVYSVQGAPGVQASYNPKWLLERLS